MTAQLNIIGQPTGTAIQTTRTACCQQAAPEECLDELCQHGRPSMWDTGRDRWEIPMEGPCGEYRTAGADIHHIDCPDPLG